MRVVTTQIEILRPRLRMTTFIYAIFRVMPGNSTYQHLAEKWIQRHENLRENLWDKHGDALKWLEHHAKEATIASVGALMLLAIPGRTHLPSITNIFAQEKPQDAPLDKKIFLIQDLASSLPQTLEPLTSDQEQKVGEVLARHFGLKASATLDSKKLNRSYGLIGKEQHLMRYPGDTMGSHFATTEEANLYGAEGMAPGRGAWGYFAPSQAQMTQEDVMREKYYIAVQTFLVPDYNSRVAEYRDFFKYRKMLVVNPQNGKAVVAVIGDAGPEQSTGKHLGGSPEIMSYLERVDGRGKGPVLYFFVDDPDNKIPLGPVNPVE